MFLYWSMERNRHIRGPKGQLVTVPLAFFAHRKTNKCHPYPHDGGQRQERNQETNQKDCAVLQKDVWYFLCGWIINISEVGVRFYVFESCNIIDLAFALKRRSFAAWAQSHVYSNDGFDQVSCLWKRPRDANTCLIKSNLFATRAYRILARTRHSAFQQWIDAYLDEVSYYVFLISRWNQKRSAYFMLRIWPLQSLQDWSHRQNVRDFVSTWTHFQRKHGSILLQPSNAWT